MILQHCQVFFHTLHQDIPYPRHATEIMTNETLLQEFEDLAEASPERLHALQELWWKEAERNRVLLEEQVKREPSKALYRAYLARELIRVDDIERANSVYAFSSTDFQKDGSA